MPATAGTVYVAAEPDGAMYSQALVGPLIKLGTEGLLRTTDMLRVPLVPQAFTACTVTALVVNVVGNVMVTVLPKIPGPAGTIVVPG